MKKLILLVAAIFIVAGTQYVTRLAPTAVIKIEAMSEEDLKAAGWETHTSSGHHNVGVGQIVYLRGSDADGGEITSYTWGIAGPDGSPVAPDMQGEEWMTFRPPTTGSYVVSLEITTAVGSSGASQTIHAGTFVGVGSVGGQNPNFRDGQCAACHSDVAEKWEGTGHSTKFQRDLDGITTSFYADRCLQCHTVGYDDSSVNNGFDDIQTELGWTIPTTLAAGNWQQMADNYPRLAAKANIQCENCHGPGSEHKGNKANIGLSVNEGVCGQCHDAEPYHVKNGQWRFAGHSVGVQRSADRTGCAGCHSTWGFIARMDPLSDHDQLTGEAPLSCAGCHDPHDATNVNQLRRIQDVELVDGMIVQWGGKGKLCMNCHYARRTGPGQAAAGSTRQDPHGSNQTDMLAATSANHFGRYIPSSTHRQALTDTCVSCHMYETADSESPAHDKIGEHSWNMHVTVDDVHYENTAACERCHGSFDDFDQLMAREDYDGDGTIEGARDEVRGLQETLAMLLPPIGEPTFTVEASWSTIQKEAAFNYNFINSDGSGGLHNFQYAVGILEVAIEAVQFGIPAPGDVTAVADVPNDQGRQVHVAWTRFGGDGPSDDPVTAYYVWRKDDIAGKGNATTLDKVSGNALGTSIDLSGETWTAVASQPAAQLDAYSAVVPTLFDGEEYATTFMVSGHSRGGTVMMSAEMEGYSVDNLVPHAPSGMVATIDLGGVSLAWTEPVDPDINYYAIYRSTSSGVVVEGAQPFGTTTEAGFVDENVATGTTYYYRVAAFDFSGNQGTPSAEVMAAVTTASETLGIPTEFALNQNYPNPFNPTTSISYDVPVTSEVLISVYDILGRQLQVLVDGSKQPGRHEIKLDASEWTSGLYIVRMKTGGRMFERSIVLMK